MEEFRRTWLDIHPLRDLVEHMSNCVIEVEKEFEEKGKKNWMPIQMVVSRGGFYEMLWYAE